MLKRRPPQLCKRHGGFVIIDVLMSVLLFSVGILGLIGLQTALTRNQVDTKVRADASYLAGELIAQIWANTTQLSSYSSSGCATMALCKEWQDKVAASLPGGVGGVAADASTGDITITITWTNPGGDQHKYVSQTTVTVWGT
ncbi:MAG: type IV pilus modification PilV family protein [Acidobacteriota bacterium]